MTVSQPRTGDSVRSSVASSSHTSSHRRSEKVGAPPVRVNKRPCPEVEISDEEEEDWGTWSAKPARTGKRPYPFGPFAHLEVPPSLPSDATEHKQDEAPAPKKRPKAILVSPATRSGAPPRDRDDDEDACNYSWQRFGMFEAHDQRLRDQRRPRSFEAPWVVDNLDRHDVRPCILPNRIESDWNPGLMHLPPPPPLPAESQVTLPTRPTFGIRATRRVDTPDATLPSTAPWRSC
eukprot:3358247-Amphidinium_carterae.1